MPTYQKIKTIKLFLLLCLFATVIACGSRERELTLKLQDLPDSTFAVVELFTSLGCATCPSAEKEMLYLSQKAEQLNIPVFILTYHVDYWNSKTWSDPYSMAACSNRQMMYAGILHTKNIYTPQSVLNGVTEISPVTSREYIDSIVKVLKSPIQKMQTIQAKIAQLGDSLRISVTLGETAPREELVIALTQRAGQPIINSGENAGMPIKCTNIVRYLYEMPCNTVDLQHTIKIPKALRTQAGNIVLLTQNKLTGRITGARSIGYHPAGLISAL